MKLSVDMPDGTLCAFISYVYNDPENGLNMAVTQLDTSMIIKAKNGEAIKIGVKQPSGEKNEVRK